MTSFWIYLFLSTKAEASQVKGEKRLLEILGKGLKLATFTTPAVAVVAALLNTGDFVPSGQIYLCLSNAPIGVILMFTFLDLGLNVGYLVYFVIPLRELMAFQPRKSESNLNRSQKLLDVAKRNLETCCMAVFSTVFSMICLAIAGSFHSIPLSVKTVLHIPIFFNILINNLAILYSTKSGWRVVSQAKGNPSTDHSNTPAIQES